MPKTDRPFVSAMARSGESFQVVRTIVSLVRNLGMDVIAEGPEDAEQVARLRWIGCEFGQGCYFSKPVDLADAIAFLARSAPSCEVLA